MAPRPGIRPPSSDVNGGSLPVSWGNGKTVAVVPGLAGQPFVTPALPRGVYTVQSTAPLYLNVGPDVGAADLDATVTSANAASAAALARAPKRHSGGDWALAVDDDEKIAIVACDATKPADVRIFKGA